MYSEKSMRKLKDFTHVSKVQRGYYKIFGHWNASVSGAMESKWFNFSYIESAHIYLVHSVPITAISSTTCAPIDRMEHRLSRRLPSHIPILSPQTISGSAIL